MHGKRWARTGTVVETGPGPRQYAVRMDGSRNVSIRNRKFLRPYTGVADVLAEEVVHSSPVAQQYQDSGDDRANQTVRQEEEVGEQPQAVDIGGGDNGMNITVQQESLPVIQRSQNASGTAGEGPRYPPRVRRKPLRFKDFEMDESG